jgi:hypothetical protein
LRAWVCSNSTTGTFTTPRASFIFAKTGDSMIRSRMNRPTNTSTMLKRNGTRQPHDTKSSSGSCCISRKIPVAINPPTALPICAKLPKKPRRPAPACSVAMSTAPPHSPPTAMPCTKRSTTMRIGAHAPMTA